MKKLIFSVMFVGTSIFAIDFGGIGGALLQNAAATAADAAIKSYSENSSKEELLSVIAKYEKELAECKEDYEKKSASDSKFTALKELGELRKSGILSEAEFNSEKKKILGN